MATLTANDKVILRRIRDKVEATHWVKNDYYRVTKTGKDKGKEKCCLVGMVNIETLPPELARTQSVVDRNLAVPKTVVNRRNRILNALLAAINQRGAGVYGYVERFNDEKKTKRKHVLDVIDDALGDK